jgi:hypothetical protein
MASDDAVAAACLTGIKASVTVVLTCSQCSFCGMNDQWIKKVGVEHFRCPQCGTFHQKWTRPPPPKVLSIAQPHTGFAVCLPCSFQSDFPQQVAGVQDLYEMAVLKAQDIQTGADLDAFWQKSADLLNELLDTVAPIGFELLNWNSKVENMLRPALFPENQWAHLKANGVLRVKTPFGGDVFDKWDELIGLLANFVAVTNVVHYKR